MNRYFFHVQDGAFKPDLDGCELASLVEARRHAIEMSASLLRAENELGWSSTEWQITVLDEGGRTVFTLNFYGTAEFPEFV